MMQETIDHPDQERQAVLDRVKAQLTDAQYQDLCKGGPFYTVEQRTLLEKVGLPLTEIDRLFPQLPTGNEHVQVGDTPESGGHIAD